MQTVHNPREKYSNLIFFGVNALFLLAIFWMLPALGGDPDQRTPMPGPPNFHAGASHPQTGKGTNPQTNGSNLLTQRVVFNFPRLAH